MGNSVPESDKLLTASEVATKFRVNPKTVTRWAKAGKLTAIRTLGGHRRYREDEVLALLKPAAETAPDPQAAPTGSLWPLSVSGSAAAVRNRLTSQGIGTVGALTALSAGDLQGIGLRPPQVDEVRLVLARKGMTLRGEILDTAA